LIGELQVERLSCHYYIQLERIGQEIVHVSGMFLSGSAANTWHGIRTFAKNKTANFMAYFWIAQDIIASQELMAW
jgi:hypothetical protein